MASMFLKEEKIDYKMVYYFVLLLIASLLLFLRLITNTGDSKVILWSHSRVFFLSKPNNIVTTHQNIIYFNKIHLLNI